MLTYNILACFCVYFRRANVRGWLFSPRIAGLDHVKGGVDIPEHPRGREIGGRFRGFMGEGAVRRRRQQVWRGLRHLRR